MRLILSISHLRNFCLIMKILSYTLFQYRTKVKKAHNLLVLFWNQFWVYRLPERVSGTLSGSQITLWEPTLYIFTDFWSLPLLPGVWKSTTLSDFISCILNLCYFVNANLVFLCFPMNWLFYMFLFITDWTLFWSLICLIFI